ncbi:hypothetical protein A2291_06200 [candidate division WOR-1 bacterium RIFOXYB2_FULL_42_35]|uniref:ComEC/Rec2-related protein domain-containing protein n=1 Tax=candidate division WOR-1 bacterium RIFOXYC2_FULL_41_25 TaxID=1802586 RepID=A0A1F4TJ31_UNCSA|nr:MAG: hypothetical protein A2291_06200 [candidate division WOR-1 bacterium RIFOXYB2_FULL_42_35]OGC32617.1 MAG: hypothetical protein A2462_01960 [candidate division WOR-1 bacterium RIFOXYC2_FULL_41_25]
MTSPIVHIAIAYVLGIIIGNSLSFPIWASLFLTVLIFVTNAYVFINKLDNRLFVLAFLVVLGTLNIQIRSLPPPRSDISGFLNKGEVTVFGQIDDEPRIFDEQVSFTLQVGKANKKKTSGKLSVSVAKTKLEYGDKVAVTGYLQEVDGLANPGLLSYADYLQNQGITCQLRSSRAPPIIISTGGGNIIKKLSLALKNHFIIVPLKTLPEPYSTLLASIVFGSSAAKAPKEIKETYKKAGVAHLLVASGMHLGILVGVCLFIVRSTKMPLSTGILITSLVHYCPSDIPCNSSCSHDWVFSST